MADNSHFFAQKLPWAIGNTDLGPSVLEIGPGPGLTTDLLRTSVPRLIALEIDPTWAGSLSSRLKGSNAQSKGTRRRCPLEIRNSRVQFHLPCCITFLLENCKTRSSWNCSASCSPAVFFVGCDSLQNWFLRIIHLGDTLVPVSPDTFGARLERAGSKCWRCERTRKLSDSVLDDGLRRPSKQKSGERNQR